MDSRHVKNPLELYASTISVNWYVMLSITPHYVRSHADLIPYGRQKNHSVILRDSNR